MGWVIFYSVLLIAYVSASLYAVHHPTNIPEIIKILSGSLAILAALAQAIARVSLRFYLFWQKFWVWWHAEKTAIWRVAMRMDGYFEADTIQQLADKFRNSTDLRKWNPELQGLTDRELRLKVDRTIHVDISYEPRMLSADGWDHVLVRSHELEVPYGAARDKIDHQITPLLSTFATLLRPHSYSIVFEVWFEERNPFFAFFVAHLRPEQVTQFNLVFKPRRLSRSEAEKIVVTQTTLEITAVTTEGFAEMAKAFVLLSADAARLSEGQV